MALIKAMPHTQLQVPDRLRTMRSLRLCRKSRMFDGLQSGSVAAEVCVDNVQSQDEAKITKPQRGSLEFNQAPRLHCR